MFEGNSRHAGLGRCETVFKAMTLSFRFAGIPVAVSLWFVALPLVVSMRDGPAKAGIWLAVVFASVFIHELGHALGMRWFGFAPRIELHGLGGRTLFPPHAKPNARQSFIITLLGPLAGLALAFGALFVAVILDPSPESLGKYALTLVMGANLFWSVFNLLPILPWDGGLILESGVELLTGKPRPRVVAASSMVLGVAVFAGAVASQSFFVGYFGLMGVWMGWLKWSTAPTTQAAQTAWNLIAQGKPDEATGVLRTALSSVREAQRPPLLEVLAWARLHAHDVVGARQAVAQLGDVLPSPELAARLAAAEGRADEVVALLEPLRAAQALSPAAVPLLAGAYLELEAPQEVLALAVSLPAAAPQTPSLWHQLFSMAFASQQLELATLVAQFAFSQSKQGVFAFNAACAFAKQDKVDEAVGSVRQAFAAGYANVEKLNADPDLAAVREKPAFQALLAELQRR
jgi:Zn-dependent protease